MNKIDFGDSQEKLDEITKINCEKHGEKQCDFGFSTTFPDKDGKYYGFSYCFRCTIEALDGLELKNYYNEYAPDVAK